MTHSANLPLILVGPLLRQTLQSRITLWMTTSRECNWQFTLHNHQGELLQSTAIEKDQLTQVKVGTHAYVTLIEIELEQDMQPQHRYIYDLVGKQDDGESATLVQLIPDIVYDNQASPNFVFTTTLDNILHGSCRKPHHDSADGLIPIDDLLAATQNNNDEQPDLLIMSGDQVYCDDVAGPMLVAIHQIIETLGLYHESLPIEGINDSKQLLTNEYCYYQRPHLLPDDIASETLLSVFFGAKKKPIFTSVNANNHLVSFAEVIAMYLLTWSPELWRMVNISDEGIPESFRPLFAQEHQRIDAFCQNLHRVRRVLAHLPVYMIFDDHDITDDWNLTRGWEEAVYNHPFAKRIVGNALIGYWLCQGLGNNPQQLHRLTEQALSHFTEHGIEDHDKLIDLMLDWDQWHYTLETTPKLVVLDTRTQRWRSESSLVKPSGLMDWEALCDLQQELIGQQSVILVSAAPVFGVKMIETIQKIFTFFGKALVVDAENWMAHKGTASVMLNIFRHYKTPPNFIILSGDVHYSFVYDIELRFRRNSPKITQITSSGIKNQFPHKLLRWFDTLNRLLYSPRSPLNWFTQRRNMTIRHRRPSAHKIGTLLNQSGIGQVLLDEKAQNIEARSILAKNGEIVTFERRND